MAVDKKTLHRVIQSHHPDPSGKAGTGQEEAELQAWRELSSAGGSLWGTWDPGGWLRMDAPGP
jgi:hypothetical protein